MEHTLDRATRTDLYKELVVMLTPGGEKKDPGSGSAVPSTQPESSSSDGGTGKSS